MQPAAMRAENAFSGSDAPAGPSSGLFSEAEMPPKDAEHRVAEAGNDAPLSRMRLEKMNRSEPLLPLPREAVSSSPPRDLTPEAKEIQRGETVETEKESGEGMMTSSDEGGGSSIGGEHQKQSSDSKSEKKKMKRFRLTHNQTRFLMSEFTRQAHPDAAHRERLSREIPGLTPRQVQVWFQNRRAKLKRLTSNDRERMLKSRALPDDFDTTQVLRTPFGGKSASETPKVLLTDGMQRPNEEEYVISPMSSASTNNGNYFSSNTLERGSENFHHPGTLPSRGAPISELQRSNRGAFPFARSSSFSEPSFNTGLHMPGRFSRPGADPLGHPNMPYTRRVMEYGIPRPGSNGMVIGYDHHRPLEGSVSPTNPQDTSMPYNVDNHSPQVQGYQSQLTMPVPKGFGGLEMNSQMQPHNRHIPNLEYRPFSYDHQSYPMNSTIPFTQANASSLSLPASFPTSDAGHVPQGAVCSAPDDRMNPPPLMDPLRSKFGNQTFEYANYL
ncbi:hypothetical protein MW887_007902 [Aspergillus wentii]|nr:hypothetical protein MW887_007902 [Aspergillus wentii]